MPPFAMRILPLGVLLHSIAAPLATAQLLFREIGKAHLPARLSTTLPLVADVDGDGDHDLLFKTPLQLLINDGAAVFVDETSGRLPASAPSTADAAAFGDVDGDGDLDLLLLGYANQRLLLNDGRGRFTDAAAGSLPPLASTVFDAAFVDVDGDLDLDCVVPGRMPPSTIVNALLLNDGRGRFTDVTSARMPPSSPYTGTVLAADVDGDNDADLVIGGAMLINVNGAFRDEAGTRWPQPLYNAAGVAADVDRDGDLDLLLETWYPTAQTRLLLNDGLGRFSDATAGRIGLGVVSAAVGDLDRDGDVDLLASATRVLLNDGRGVFVESGARAVPERCGAWTSILVDADGDGDLDAVVTGPGLFLNDGSARFVDASEARCPSGAPYARHLVTFDADGDLDLDVLVLASDPTLYLNDGDGRLLPDWSGRFPPFAFLQTNAGAAGDVDGDGDADLLIAGDSNYPAFRLLLNDGRGFFRDAPAGRFSYAASYTVAVEFTDIDADGDLDVLAIHTRQPSALFVNDGRGAFANVSASHLPARTDPVARVAVADYDGNGSPDVFVACNQAQPRLWLNDGSGRLVDVTSSRLPAQVLTLYSATAGDIDGDGDVDILALGEHRVFVNDGTGRFSDGTSGRLPTPAYTATGKLIDVDADGDPDVFAAGVLWLNDGSGRFTDVTATRTAFRAEQVNAEAVADLDGDGDLDLVVAGAYSPLRLYFNHHRQLATPLLARAGRAYDVVLEARPGTAPPGQLGVVLLGARRLAARVPVGSLGLLALDPGAPIVSLATVSISTPAGRGVLPLVLPADPALQGAQVNLQAVLLHDVAPATWRFTNAVLDTVHGR